MLFPSATFLVFFPIVFLIAWAFHKKLTFWKTILVLSSMLFYGWWSWAFLILLIGNALSNFLFAILIARSGISRKYFLISAISLNLLVLGMFKYYKFFYSSIIDVFPNAATVVPALEIILPVGISFYTFQGISYVVDVYRREVRARNLVDVMCYQMFFPQLVAGPIVRAASFLPQLDRAPRLSRTKFNKGLTFIVSGLVLKLLVANYLAQSIVDPVFAYPTSFDSTQILTGVYAYSMQIYCDFSGYTLMAIGIAALLGLHLPRNFNRPYLATSLQDFWRRWHISLSSWLRDYLYKPIGGSRRGGMRTLINLAIVMVLGGLWHGAGWNFLLWGALHGAGLIVVFLTKQSRYSLPSALSWFITFHFVCFCWIFFRAPDMYTATAILEGIVANQWGSQPVPGLIALICTPILLDAIVGLPGTARLKKKILKANCYLSSLVAFGIISIILIVAPPTEAPFIYFQF